MAFQRIFIVHEFQHTDYTVTLHITVESLPVYEPLVDIASLNITAEGPMILSIELFD